MDDTLGLQRINGFDYLRVLFMGLIVAWHTVDVSTIKTLESYVFYYNFCLVGVPIFFMMSLYLLNVKLMGDNLYFKNRFTSILKLYLFWVIFNIVAKYFSNDTLTLTDVLLATQKMGCFSYSIFVSCILSPIIFGRYYTQIDDKSNMHTYFL